MSTGHGLSRIYQGILDLDSVADIIAFYDTQPGQTAESNIVNKNLEYHIPENFIHRLMYPILYDILGPDHEFDTGSYKSSQRPYIIHVDSRQQHDQYPDCMSFGSGRTIHNKAVLVPLVEGPQFRTVTFPYWSSFNPVRQDLMQAATDASNHLLAEDFAHEPMFRWVNRLKVDIDYQWHLGDILVWDRNQWHMSSDFNRHGLEKQFLVFFMS